jgi:hypothetical protein
MNDLLARLSRGKGAEPEPPRPTSLQPIVATVASAKHRRAPDRAVRRCRSHRARRSRPARTGARAPRPECDRRQPFRRADPDLVTQQGHEVSIDVIDSGSGMSAEFVRTRLFQPFASTKDGGFGIGAFEARSLVAAMGGRLEVESREGEGSRFTITLPVRETTVPAIEQRMRA